MIKYTYLFSKHPFIIYSFFCVCVLFRPSVANFSPSLIGSALLNHRTDASLEVFSLFFSIP